MLPATIVGLADGTSSPVDNNVAAPKPVKLICSNWVDVNAVLLEPTNILPAVPELPAVPDQPFMVKIFPAVQLTPLLAEKTRLCDPVPKLIVASLVRAMVDIVSP